MLEKILIANKELTPLSVSIIATSLLCFHQLCNNSCLLPLRFHLFSTISKAKLSWNSNNNLIVTHPILSVMESCASMAELRQIQAQFTRKGLIEHRFAVSRIIAFCALFDEGDMNHARLLFDKIPDPNTYIWNTMIRGYTRCGFPLLSISFLKQMIDKIDNVDGRTWVFALKAYEFFPEILLGEGVHGLVSKQGFNLEMLVQNSLMHYYVKLGELPSAERVFDEILEPDIVSWTTIIDGYLENSLPIEALRIFQCLSAAGVQSNAVTMIAVLSACSQMGFLDLGSSIHGYIEKSSLCDNLNMMNALVVMYGKCGCLGSAKKIFDEIEIKDVFSWTCMLSGYCRFGDLETARKFFDKMPEKNVVSWSSMIAGYAQANRPWEALDLFREMIAANVEPTSATLASILSACAQASCLHLGKWIYGRYIVMKRLKLNLKLSNAFIDMFAKCGDIDMAAKIFHVMPQKDIVSWNSMILGFASHGNGIEAVALFEQLKGQGFVPDDITFVGVLSACSHVGLVSEGRRHFFDMKAAYGIEPKAAHYACMIDLLGRVGLVADAFGLVANMPMEPDLAGWGALLNACKMHGSLELGSHAGEKLLDLDPSDSGVYSLLSSIYATCNKWEEVKKLRMIMKSRKVKKTPGCSIIEIEGKFHEFLATDMSHICSISIYAVLEILYIHLSKANVENEF
ncbi:Pentatricopeptide repeat-containing protein [Apostasia shenzhenica]|uniref:Pentatricopeptide repeat-containing protein n=1 Tax=Apostasia shenzhenica TaxID=1088818 RepID=A0A2I0B8Z5_9ASPA|nr:Pentatricopeptide repeat-containing protein [Apostasia shenzhenica]